MCSSTAVGVEVDVVVVVGGRDEPSVAAVLVAVGQRVAQAARESAAQPGRVDVTDQVGPHLHAPHVRGQRRQCLAADVGPVGERGDDPNRFLGVHRTTVR
jgi:hypothetical protein